MRRIKKYLILLMLLLNVNLVPIFATGYPVIDFTAISTTLKGMATEAAKWQQNLKKWKAEYDKAIKAAKGIASGDFKQIVSSIGSYAQIAKNFTNTDTEGMNKWAQSLDGISGTASDFLKIYGTSELLIKNFPKVLQTLVADISESAKKIQQNKYNTATDYIDGIGATGDYLEDVYNMEFGLLEGLLNKAASFLDDSEDSYKEY